MERIIRASVPNNFNALIHRVVSFTRENYDNEYTLNSDGFYTYKGVSAEASIHYSELALLGLSNMKVTKFVNRLI